MSELELPHYPPFYWKVEGKSIWWARWVARLKNVFVGYNIESNKRKKALLLTFEGEELNDIMDSLPESLTTVGGGENVFDTLVTAITEDFNPSTNVELMKYTFCHMQQTSDNIDSFYNELQQVATTCAFAGRQWNKIAAHIRMQVPQSASKGAEWTINHSSETFGVCMNTRNHRRTC